MPLFSRRLFSPGAAVASKVDDAQHRAYATLDELMRLRWSAKRLHLRPNRKVLQQTAGGRLSRFRSRGVDFAEVRQYQPGDDVRTIDWRVTARRGKPHTKLFQEERERPVLLVVDQTLSQFFGSRLAFKSVRAAEVAALLAWAALQNGDRLGGLVFSDFGSHEHRPTRSDKDTLRFLQLLAAFNKQLRLDQTRQAPSFDLNQALTELRRISKPGSLIFVISDFQDMNDDTWRHLHLLARHNDIVAIQTYDPLEADLPPAGLYGISDGQHQLRFDSGNRKLRQGFQQLFEERQQALRQHLNQAAISLFQVSTQDQPLDVLMRAFGKK